MTIEFCLPIYNEEKILADNVSELLNFCLERNYNFSWKIVLIVNGSSDQSHPIGLELSARFPDGIKCVNYPEPGRGRALKRYYLVSAADILVYMDVDLAVSLDDIDALINPLITNQADLTIGSRLLPASKIKRSWLRELSSQTYNFLSKVILIHNFSDLQCGFKAIKSDVFKRLAPWLKDNKWFFDTELIAFANHFNYRIKEIPVDWSENRWEDRKSKVNLLRDSMKFIISLLRLKFRMMKTKNKQ